MEDMFVYNSLFVLKLELHIFQEKKLLNFTHRKFNSKRPWKVTETQQEMIVFQPPIFRAYIAVKLRGCTQKIFCVLKNWPDSV